MYIKDFEIDIVYIENAIYHTLHFMISTEPPKNTFNFWKYIDFKITFNIQGISNDISVNFIHNYTSNSVAAFRLREQMKLLQLATYILSRQNAFFIEWLKLLDIVTLLWDSCL